MVARRPNTLTAHLAAARIASGCELLQCDQARESNAAPGFRLSQ